ncbi:MAG: MFS transporter, partial [Gammaproteobacteria bacterium]
MANTNSFGLKRWGMFAIISLIFFLITGATYGSLGVVLPFMIRELDWSYTEIGTGFTILGLMNGMTAILPALMLRRFGIKATYGVGGLAMVVGFSLLAICTDLSQYFIAAALLGYGFSHCANVPGIHLINNRLADKRSFAIGAYMTIGGLGGVAGPLLVTGVESLTGSWRNYWWLATAAILLLTLLAMLFVQAQADRTPAGQETVKPPREKHTAAVYQTGIDWSYRAVMRCPQFYIIVAAMTMTLFCAITISSWAVIHIGTFGIATATAATAMSVYAALNALSRAFGGLLSTRIDPKWLLLSALIAEIIGILALSVADNIFMVAVFVLGEGYGFGMCFFTTTVLLINYFGPKNNPEILGSLNMITTLATAGPILAGYLGDRVGGFAGVFQGYAVSLVIIAIAVAVVRPPHQHRVYNEEEKSFLESE